MESTRLSVKEMWEGIYDAGPRVSSHVSPDTECWTYELVRVFRKYLPSTGGRLIEMGCGGSRYLPWIAREMHYAVEGVDYTIAGCQSARNNLDAAGVQGQIHCEDFLALPDRFDGAFDVVTSYGVVEHFANPGDVLRAFARCLRPGGILVTSVPNMLGLPGHLLKRIDRTLFETHHLFDLDALRGFHSNAELDILHGRYCEWLELFPLLHLARPGGLIRRDGAIDLILKNFVHCINQLRLFAMKRIPSFDPQSKFLCSGMIVVAAKPQE